MDAVLVQLKGVRLPPQSPVARRHVRRGKRLTEHYLAHYDRHTLIYDCFYDDRSQRFVFTAPRLLNLWPIIKQHLYLDGEPYRGAFKRRVFQRGEQFSVPGHHGQVVELRHPSWSQRVNVRPSLRAVFAGLDTLLAMNRNNDLEWIRQWAAFHARAHGAEGVVVIDNGSTRYSAEAVLTTLQGVTGLKSVAVIEANFPYGPVDNSGKAIVSPRFLQTSMLNLVRQDCFADARAVLSVDIDELVVSETGASVFDAAVNSQLGLVSFREQKVYALGGEGQSRPQSEHTATLPGQPPGNTKWCLASQGFLNRFSWAVHRFGGPFFPLTETSDFRYLHCQHATTGWKKNRLQTPVGVIDDAAIGDVLRAYLP